jgi:external thioesterase TEII
MLRLLKPSRNGKMMYCFPSAGGYSVAFQPLAQFFQSDWGITAIDPPGHGTNRSPLLTDVYAMVNAYSAALVPRLASGAPFVFYGHSLGGLIAYLITHRLEQRGVYPEKLFLSACNSPEKPPAVVSNMSEDQFVEFVMGLGGLSEEMVASPELLSYFMPILRADFRAIESFQPREQYHVRTPLYVISGAQDDVCTVEDGKSWAKYGTVAEHHVIDAGHMFILSHPEEVASYVVSRLGSRVVL